MIEGTIVKGIAGFYYVSTDLGLYECKARGIFRKEKITPLVGDHVSIQVLEEPKAEKLYGTAWIEVIHKRRNAMIRPPVANVDQALVVFSVAYPQLHIDLLDRFLIIVEKEGIEPYIILNKIDEAEQSNYEELVLRYRTLGYNVLLTSAKLKEHVEDVKAILKDKISFVAGPSGVGKSTLINALEPQASMETGEISEKIKRGKHTTRHVELLTLKMGGYILDTPGFTSLQLTDIEADELKYYFREFQSLEGDCKFSGCTHTHEPGCKIKEAVEQGQIFEQRYDSYVGYYNQLKEKRKW